LRIIREDGIMTKEEKSMIGTKTATYALMNIAAYILISVGSWALIRFVVLEEGYGGWIAWLVEAGFVALYSVMALVLASLAAMKFDAASARARLTYQRR
jgi:hypothetical protein